MKYAAYSTQYSVLSTYCLNPKTFVFKVYYPKHIIHLFAFSPNKTYYRKYKRAMTEVTTHTPKAYNRRLGKRTANPI